MINKKLFVSESPVHSTFSGFVRVFPILTFFSGFAALIYETLWLRSFGLIFGNTTHAITVILATYMGGIAIGSYLIGKVKISNPLKSYLFIELLMGISAVLAFILLKWMPHFWSTVFNSLSLPVFLETTVRILIVGFIILIPTFAMGATVPLLVQVLSQRISHHKALTRLYYMNTLGGATGVIVSTFLFFPVIGLFKSYAIAVIINFLIAGTCYWLIGKHKFSSLNKSDTNSYTHLPKLEIPNSFISIAIIAGATSFCLEILWSRSFALVIGSSIYSFNLMLFSFLLGMVIGTWLYEKYWMRIKNPSFLLVILLIVIGGGILLSVFAIGRLPLLYYWLMGFLPMSFALYQVVGFALCFFIMVLLTSVFGFIFPLLLQLVGKDSLGSYNSRLISSKLYAWNTLGTIVGAILTGFIIIPVYGLQNSFVIAAALPLISGIILFGIYKKWNFTWKLINTLAVIAGIVIISIIWRPWNLQVVTAGLYKYGLQQDKSSRMSIKNLVNSYRISQKLVYYKEGIEGVVAVTQSEGLGLFLSVNGKTDASTEDQVTQKMLAHVPLLLKPNSKNALIIGWGSGCTSATAGLYPLQSIETVEIEPEVYHSKTLFKSINNEIYNDPRFQIVFKDGRNVLLTSNTLYDVIISEPSNPWITGVSNLFTLEFYQSGLNRLSDSGIFCQWFHIYDMPLDVFKSQMRTFSNVFPEAMLWIVPPEHMRLDDVSSFLNGDILLIGCKNEIRIDGAKTDSLFNNSTIVNDLKSCGINNPLSFMSNAILNKNGLLIVGEDAVINSDDFPYIEFNAPRGLYNTRKNLKRQIDSIYAFIQTADTTILPFITEGNLISDKSIEQQSALYIELGDLYLQKSLKFKAERAYKYAYELQPQVSTALKLVDFYLRNKDEKQSISWAEKVLTHDKDNLQTINLLGSIYLNTGNLEKAKRIYAFLAEKFPANEAGPLNLGMIYYKEKNFTEADKYLRKALSINPGLKQAELVLKMIKDLV